MPEDRADIEAKVLAMSLVELDHVGDMHPDMPLEQRMVQADDNLNESLGRVGNHVRAALYREAKLWGGKRLLAAVRNADILDSRVPTAEAFRVYESAVGPRALELVLARADQTLAQHWQRKRQAAVRRRIIVRIRRRLGI